MSVQAYAAGRIVTGPAPGGGAALLGVDDAALLIEGGQVVRVVPRAEIPAEATLVLDAPDALITAGLVDAHTHAAWAGSRHDEYAVRMAGGDYEDIARAGGGIKATQRAVEACSEASLAAMLERRLGRMAQLGVTACEVKSGYGLTPELELKQLRAIARVATRTDLPRVVATFLGLHALPPGVDRNAYVRRVARELVPEIAAQRLAAFADAYVDRNAFTVDEARQVGEAARTGGLGLRMHVGQFADVGGAELCAELGARAADHLENVGPAGIERLAEAGTFAGLLPVACFTLRQAPPPVEALRAAGVPMVVASDANPGTAPTESLPLAMAFAVRLYGLTPAEALLGATSLAARSLDLTSGALVPGSPADFVVWDLPHENALVQPWGAARTRATLRDGRVIAGSLS